MGLRGRRGRRHRRPRRCGAGRAFARRLHCAARLRARAGRAARDGGGDGAGPGERAEDWWANTGYRSADEEDVYYHDVPPGIAADAAARSRGQAAKPMARAVAAGRVAGRADALPALPRGPRVPGRLAARRRAASAWASSRTRSTAATSPTSAARASSPERLAAYRAELRDVRLLRRGDAPAQRAPARGRRDPARRAGARRRLRRRPDVDGAPPAPAGTSSASTCRSGCSSAPAGGPGQRGVRARRRADPPFEPASFDAVISRCGLMFFADPDAAFANLRRALRPGGAARGR